jgi:hypothetical protein
LHAQHDYTLAYESNAKPQKKVEVYQTRSAPALPCLS